MAKIRRIVRTTVSNVDRFCREAGGDVADALVICMWTGPDRSEHFRARPDRAARPGPEGHPLAEAHANFAGLVATWLAETGAV